MIALFNQFSFVLVALVVGGGLAYGLWRWRRAHPLLRAGLLAWYGFGVLLLALAMRYPTAIDATTPAEVEAVIGNGQPTLVMLYSNY